MKNFRWEKLQSLTLLVMITIAPSILAGIGLTSYRAIKIIRRDAKEIIGLETEKLEGSISQWLRNNVLLLKNMSQQPDLISLDPKRQQPVLKTALVYYDNIYLAHTANLKGTNITRSDRQAPQNYADRSWFKGAIAGNDVTEQTLISKASQKPTLCTAAPVKQEGIVVATLTTCSYLDAIAEWVEQIDLGQTGIAIVVNDKGEILAHSDPQYTFGEKLADFSEYLPVANLLAGNEGTFIFTDDAGVEWIADGRTLSNSWAVITLQRSSEAFAAEQPFQMIAIAVIVLTLFVIAILISEFVFVAKQETVKQRQLKEQHEQAIHSLIEAVLKTKDRDSSVRANIDLEELSSFANLLDAIIDNIQEMTSEREFNSRVDPSLQAKESLIRLLVEQAISETQITRKTRR